MDNEREDYTESNKEKKRKEDRVLERKINESVKYLADIIKTEYERNPSGGVINGFTLPTYPCGIISKQEAKEMCYIDKHMEGTIYRQGVEDTESKMMKWMLTAYLIAYCVGNKLRDELKEYSFKKVLIEEYNFTEYKYRDKKLIRYWGTGYRVPFLHFVLKW